MENEWWPSLEEYNPNISKEKWLEILDNRNLTTEQNLHVFACIFNFGGEATCTQLAHKYGDTKNTYNSGSSNYAKNLVKANICEEPPFREDGNSRWWPVLYVGHNAEKETSGSYVWKLRDELKEACKEYGIEKWLNIAKEDKSISKRIWKLSHGKDFSEDDVQYYLSESIACVHKDTSAKGVSYLPQGKAFTDEAKSGDLFYLCRGNQEILLIGEFISNEVDIDTDGWAYRKYKKLYSSIKKGSYTGPNKWWTPNNNSTFIEIKKNEYSDFEEHILIPFFGINLQILNLVSGESKMDKIEECKKLLENTHNLIFHGAPGTGKTHLAKQIAKEMGCSDDEIGFVQFHPSYDYTDFVEGLRPVKDENGEVNFKRMDGVFKKFCIKALQTNDFYSDQNIFDNLYEYLCNQIALSENEYIEIPLLSGKGILKLGFNETGTGLMSFDGTKKYFTKEQLYNVYLGKLGVPSGGHDTYRKAIITYLNKYKFEKYISLFEKKNSIFSIVGDNGQEIQIEIESDGYKILSDDRNITVNRSDIFDYWDNQNNYKQKTNNNYSYTYSIGDYILSTFNGKDNKINRKFVFIIDEINRGELSKIFGELFYSIDPGYRINVPKLDKQNLPVTIKTQYSNMQNSPNEFDVLLNEQEDFGHFFIPDNVYIIGTMNDIDRSVESMDFAFRRRFTFKEITAKDSQEAILSELDDSTHDEAVKRMDSLNNAIDEIDGLSSAYHIGGAYFLKLKDLDDDFEALWDYHLEGLLHEYLRGMEDAEELLKKLHKAYNLKNQE